MPTPTGRGHVQLGCGHTSDEIPLAQWPDKVRCPVCENDQDARRVVDAGTQLLTNRPPSETDWVGH